MKHTTNSTMVMDDYVTDPDKYQEFLTESAPIIRAISPQGMPVWMITSHELGKFVLSDTRFLRDFDHISEIHERNGKYFMRFSSLKDGKGFESHMLNKDGADHARLRKLAMKAFRPGNINSLSPRITEITRELLGKIPAGQVVNFTEALSYPLPITMICEILGIPEADRADFRYWSHTMIDRKLADNAPEVLACRDALYNKFVEVLAHKRQELVERAPMDLFDELIVARDEYDQLNDKELLSMAGILLIAGHETTVNMLNYALVRLATIPGLADELRAHPEKIKLFIEEILRIDSPVRFAPIRYATESIELGTVHIEKDDLVIVALQAANTDGEAYADPTEFSVEEKAGHLAFGYGLHHCLGAALARNEGVLAVTELVHTFSDMQLAIPERELEWRLNGILGGYEAVPLIVQR